MNTPHDLYRQGFNEGYAVSEHLPDAARALSEITPSSSWATGFRDGCEQYVYDSGPLPEMAELGRSLGADGFLVLYGDFTEDEDMDEPDAEFES